MGEPQNPAFDRTGFREDMGARVAYWRKQKKLTQEDMAAAIGMPRASFANIERGRQGTAADLLWRVAVVLDVEIEKLLPERA